jgi:hypothetical protein
VRAVDQLYKIAPKGSLLLAGSPNVPWKDRHYADYRYQLLSRQLVFGNRLPDRAQIAATVARYMRGDPSKRAYLVITRSQRIYDEVLGAQWWGSASDVERAVMRSPRFTTLFDNGDGRIFALKEQQR